jgi:hypothetical protein
LLLAVLPLVAAADDAATSDGVLHIFYGLAIEKNGNTIVNVKTSKDVVLNNPIEIDFEGCCKVSLEFTNGQSDEFALALVLRELTPGTEDSFGLPVNHIYNIQLDEQLQFSIQTSAGLVLSGDLKLTKVSRLEVAT